jgi:outer membrane biosynthesis protein TonB
MIPNTQPRKVKNSSKVNLLISFIFHAVLVLALLYFAAREGLLGKKLEKISVQMVKEKPPEKPKEPPKIEPPKIETPKIEPPKIVESRPAAPPTVAPPTVAPPVAELPSFDFSGGKEVVSSSDPVQIYKGYMEYVLRSKWDKPDDMADDNYVVEMSMSVGKDGQLGAPVVQKSSGNEKWDDSVKQVFNLVKNFDRPPPTNFPPVVTIRFDVQLEDVESVLQ